MYHLDSDLEDLHHALDGRSCFATFLAALDILLDPPGLAGACVEQVRCQPYPAFSAEVIEMDVLGLASVAAWPFEASDSDPNYEGAGKARIGFAACSLILQGIVDPVGNSPKSTEIG